MARFRLRLSHDSHSCYELFRLALAEGNQQAWQAIYNQYHRLVHRWLGNPPGDLEDLVNQVFTRFWRNITPEKFANFPTLSHILQYLKLCASGVAIDAERAETRQQTHLENIRSLEQYASYAEPHSSIDEHVMEKIHSEELFTLASQCLKGFRYLGIPAILRIRLTDFAPRYTALLPPSVINSSCGISCHSGVWITRYK